MPCDAIKRSLSDLCIRSEKLFTHEYALYQPTLLPIHLPLMHHRQHGLPPKDQIEGVTIFNLT